MAKITGQDWSRVARVLKLLELPKPVLDYVRTHDTPAFTDRRLRELLNLKDRRLIWSRFQKLLVQIDG